MTAASEKERGAEIVVEYLRHHDALCPACAFDLKGLAEAVCPGCHHSLNLSVGSARLRLGWLLVAVAPGFFFGITAAFLAIPIVARLVVGDGRWSPALTGIDLFGWLSGVAAVLLIAKRRRFLALSRRRQRWVAGGVWAVNIIAVFMFVLAAPRYL
ncbi:MAG: hypothetical protein ACF8PN_03705 [Phycisphaerales bacterium]